MTDFPVSGELSAEDLDRLERLAKAATPGPWEADDEMVKAEDDIRPSTSVYGKDRVIGQIEAWLEEPNGTHENETYIAALAPEVVFRLINAARQQPERDHSGDTAEAREDVVSGELCFTGTRIPVRCVLSFASSGYTPKAIQAEYPDLDLPQITAAIALLPSTDRVSREVVYFQQNHGWGGIWEQVIPEAAGEDGVVAFQRLAPLQDREEGDG